MQNKLTFNMPEIKINKINLGEININTKYMTPKKEEMPAINIKINNAAELASKIKLSESQKYYAITNGNFIFCDFISCWIVMRKLKIKELTIATLSLSEDNIITLAGLVKLSGLKKLNLIVSDYFYSHNKKTAIPVIYKILDIESLDFQLSVASSHCKITLIHTECDRKIVMDGSANLKSSGDLEQLRVELNEELYDFNYEFLMQIQEKYHTIKKSLRRKTLWDTIK